MEKYKRLMCMLIIITLLTSFFTSCQQDKYDVKITVSCSNGMVYEYYKAKESRGLEYKYDGKPISFKIEYVSIPELPELDEYIKGEGKFSARLYYLGEDGTGFPSSGQSVEVEYALDVGEYALVIIAKPTYDNVKWKYAKYVRFLSVVDN